MSRFQITKLRIDVMAWLIHRGRPQSQSEIAQAIGCKSSKQALHQSLQRMVKDGLIEREADSCPITYRPLVTKKRLKAEIASRDEGHTPDSLDWTG